MWLFQWTCSLLIRMSSALVGVSGYPTQPEHKLYITRRRFPWGNRFVGRFLVRFEYPEHVSWSVTQQTFWDSHPYPPTGLYTGLPFSSVSSTTLPISISRCRSALISDTLRCRLYRSSRILVTGFDPFRRNSINVY
jgi:hypothetical protein